MKLLLAALLGLTAAHAESLPNYSDWTRYTCDKDIIGVELGKLFVNSTAGEYGWRVVYVKDITETSRTADELQCRVTAVTNHDTAILGAVRFVNWGGKNLIWWTPDMIE